MFFWRYLLPLALILGGGLLCGWALPQWLDAEFPVDMQTGLASISALAGAAGGFVMLSLIHI